MDRELWIKIIIFILVLILLVIEVIFIPFETVEGLMMIGMVVIGIKVVVLILLAVIIVIEWRRRPKIQG